MTDQTLGEATVNSLTNSIIDLTKMLPILGNAAVNLGATLESQIDKWEEFARNGAAFNNNLLQLAASTSAARLSFTELQQILTKGGDAFSALSGSFGDGALEFTKASNAFFTATTTNGKVIQRYSDQLRGLGYTNEELNTVLSTVISSYQRSSKTRSQIETDAITKTVSLATEMDKLAKLTGVSRKQQEENLEKVRKSADIEAAIRLAAAKSGLPIEEFKLNVMSKFGIVFSTLGEKAQQLLGDYLNFGAPTDKTIGYSSMAGAEFNALLQNLADMIRSGNIENSDQVISKLVVAATKMSNNTSLIQLGNLRIEDAMQVLSDFSRTSASVISKQNELRSQNLPSSDNDAVLAVLKDIAAQQQANDLTQLLVDSRAMKDELTAALNSALLMLSNNTKQFVGLAENTVTAIRNNIGSFKPIFDKISNITELVQKGASRAEIDKAKLAVNADIERLMPEIANKGIGAEIVGQIKDFLKNTAAAASAPAKPTLPNDQGLFTYLKTEFSHLFDWIKAKVGITPSPTPVNIPAPKAKAVGGKMNAGELNVLNVAGTPYFYNENRPEYVLNEQQVGLMQANFLKSLQQNQSVLDSINNLSTSTMEKNQQFISKLSSITESLKEKESNVTIKNLSDFQGIVNKASTTTTDTIAAFFNKSDLNKDRVSESINKLNSTLLLNDESIKPEERTIVNPDLVQPPVPTVNVDVAVQTSDPLAESSKIINDNAKAQADLSTSMEKLVVELQKPKTDTSTDILQGTMKEILTELQRLNIQTRESIEQDSKYASNIITATKRLQGYT